MGLHEIEDPGAGSTDRPVPHAALQELLVASQRFGSSARSIAERFETRGAMRQNLDRVDAPAKPGTDFPGVIDVLGTGYKRLPEIIDFKNSRFGV